MQMKKAGAVAVGALATVAVIGAPAAAANPTQAKAQSMREVSSQFLGNARAMWSAPWEGPQQALAIAGAGSVANGAAWQVCGSDAVAGVGATVNASGADTVLDGCTNANIWLKQDAVSPLGGVLNDTATAVASWQACGSTVMGGAGGTVAMQVPHTVLGGCDNSNIVIGGPDGKYTEAATVATARTKLTMRQKLALKAAKQAAKRQRLANRLAGGSPADVVRAAFMVRKDALLAQRQQVSHATAAPKADLNGTWGAPWEFEPQSLVTTGVGSAAQGASWQACGGTAVWGVGGVVSRSPNTVFGDCRNATVKITQGDPNSIGSALDNASVNLAPWQVCGSNTVSGVGGTAALQTPNTVFGGCHNADTIID